MHYLKSAALSIIFATALTLTTLAEEITTGNLLPNGTGSASNLQSVDTSIPNVQSNCSSFTSVNTTCTNSNWNYRPESCPGLAIELGVERNKTHCHA